MATTLLDCGHEPSPHSEFTTGYGLDDQGRTFCYDCCAKNDREQMRRDGKTTLYFTRKDGRTIVSNWPGSLIFPTRETRTSENNWGATRTDFWFEFEGDLWHGTHVGSSHQLATCRRTKTRTRAA